MIQKMNKTRLLIWVIIILVAVNLATIISGVIYSSKSRNTEPTREEVPFNQRAKFFHDQLGLTQDQRNSFLQFNREFNQEARGLTDKMNTLRHRMVQEMAASNPDRGKLDKICNDIGSLHSQLKKATVDYYLKMKNVCDSEQQKLLSNLFERMLNSDGNIEMMRPGFGRQNRGMGNGRGKQNNMRPMFN